MLGRKQQTINKKTALNDKEPMSTVIHLCVSNDDDNNGE